MSQLALEPTVQVSLITAGGTVLVTLLGIGAEFMRRQAKAINEVAEHAAEARDQVANTHSTNLRDDLDAVAYRIDRVLQLQEQHSQDIAALRQDIAHERRERLAVSERLDDHMAATNA
ncbi:hypothetical protein phiHau3_27 [Streptomyces phage phiHau3]|uniref:Uncharacterized protein n=1 Tax=Streptomyces phage phiHau3 TaxID=1204524 RepID=K4IB04_9CAUD|nr:hypothetical protein phiHau3_27 [Streptomyces phage phiHau3]AFU62004.1 hypothetical protein phiHau3_27 [Streptomyces phage phiHau3]